MGTRERNSETQRNLFELSTLILNEVRLNHGN